MEEKLRYLSSIIKELDTKGVYLKQMCVTCKIIYRGEPKYVCALDGCDVNYCFNRNCTSMPSRMYKFMSCINEKGELESRCSIHCGYCVRCHEPSTTTMCHYCLKKKEHKQLKKKRRKKNNYK